MRELKNHPSADQLDSYDEYPCYYGDDLELVYTPKQSVFTLWAPSAGNVRLNLYSSGEGGKPEEQIEMEMADDGTWYTCVDRDLKGTFYTFQIKKDWKMAGRNTWHLGKGSRHQRQPRRYNRLE